jgi:hypothetical protein
MQLKSIIKLEVETSAPSSTEAITLRLELGEYEDRKRIATSSWKMAEDELDVNLAYVPDMEVDSLRRITQMANSLMPELKTPNDVPSDDALEVQIPKIGYNFKQAALGKAFKQNMLQSSANAVKAKARTKIIDSVPDPSGGSDYYHINSIPVSLNSDRIFIVRTVVDKYAHTEIQARNLFQGYWADPNYTGWETRSGARSNNLPAAIQRTGDDNLRRFMPIDDAVEMVLKYHILPYRLYHDAARMFPVRGAILADLAASSLDDRTEVIHFDPRINTLHNFYFVNRQMLPHYTIVTGKHPGSIMI